MSGSFNIGKIRFACEAVTRSAADDNYRPTRIRHLSLAYESRYALSEQRQSVCGRHSAIRPATSRQVKLKRQPQLQTNRATIVNSLLRKTDVDCVQSSGLDSRSRAESPADLPHSRLTSKSPRFANSISRGERRRMVEELLKSTPTSSLVFSLNLKELRETQIHPPRSWSNREFRFATSGLSKTSAPVVAERTQQD